MTFKAQPVIVLLTKALLKVAHVRSSFNVEITAAVFTWALLPKPSIIPLWGSLTFLVSRWPAVVNRSSGALVHGGPLGPGCFKFVEVLCGVALWRLINKEWPGIKIGPLPSWQALVAVAILSGGVNLVLYRWSRFSKSRGDHRGVNEMVETSIHRSLSFTEHVQILSLAFLNAICEETTSRFFWMAEFQKYTGSSIRSNFLQAVVFGMWHYHGIPSGLAGVALTFIYGGIMGLLYHYGQGILLPVIAHAISDYYIFASVARQKAFARSTN
jgi:membrane protease YdiL (CAAX protease family)